MTIKFEPVPSVDVLEDNMYFQLLHKILESSMVQLTHVDIGPLPLKDDTFYEIISLFDNRTQS